MAMEPQQAIRATGEPQLFLLRVWQEQGAFRAALRQVGSGEPSYFTRPVDVGEFLCLSLQTAVATEQAEVGGTEP